MRDQGFDALLSKRLKLDDIVLNQKQGEKIFLSKYIGIPKDKNMPNMIDLMIRWCYRDAVDIISLESIVQGTMVRSRQ
jgi:hypothetical protein